MLPNETLDAALTDAVPLGQLPLRRTRSEGRDELFSVYFGEPVPNNAPLTGTLGGADAERRLTRLRLSLPKLMHCADQRVCEVPAVQVRRHKVHPGDTLGGLFETCRLGSRSLFRQVLNCQPPRTVRREIVLVPGSR
jgi:hypothetical protein